MQSNVPLSPLAAGGKESAPQSVGKMKTKV
jgi:hypothetical protein